MPTPEHDGHCAHYHYGKCDRERAFRDWLHLGRSSPGASRSDKVPKKSPLQERALGLPTVRRGFAGCQLPEACSVDLASVALSALQWPGRKWYCEPTCSQRAATHCCPRCWTTQVPPVQL